VTTQDEADRRARLERARATGLFRYSLIQELTGPELTPGQRGRLARELASRAHDGPGGQQVRVSRKTIDRWRRAYEAGGFDALVPSPRQCSPRTPAEVLDLAAALKKENPGRTAAQVQRILRASAGWAPSDRTLQRLFERLELTAPPPDEDSRRAFGRFEAGRPNELRTGDALHGPRIAGRKTYLFCFLDDHSRAVMAARFGHGEDVVRLAAALRPALASRGVPQRIYVDNGSAFVDAWLLRACAVLGIRLVHSRPGKPEGRGKIERFFRTVRDQFLVETGDGSGVGGLAELNRLFAAWTETCYHRAVHSETGQEPLARWASGTPAERAVPAPEALREAFLWSERRVVTKTATVSLHGNVYQVGPSLVRRTVELVFDPFDLTAMGVRHQGKPAGTAQPSAIGRHAHPKTRSRDSEPRAEPEPAGIDYLRLPDQRHDQALRGQISYAALAGGGEQPREHQQEGTSRA
jgi:putative transposase